MKNRILGFVSILILILAGAVSQAQVPQGWIVDGLVSASSTSVESVEVYPGGRLVVKVRQGYDGELASAAFNLSFGLSREQIDVLRTQRPDIENELIALTDTDLKGITLDYDGTNLVTTAPLFDHDKWCKETHD